MSIFSAQIDAPWALNDIYEMCKNAMFDIVDWVKELWDFLYSPLSVFGIDTGYSLFEILLGSGVSILIAFLTAKVVVGIIKTII